MKDLMLKFSCMMTGDDYQLLKSNTPSSKKKVKTLVSVMFLPVITWVIIVFLLVKGVMEGTKQNAVIAASIAGVIIFIVERSIIMSNGSKVVIAFRFILGFLIAMVGSLAIDEVIFKSDIDQQLDNQKSEQFKQNDEVIERIYKDKILFLEQSVENKRQLWNRSLDIARQEASGDNGMPRGVGPVTRFKMSIARQNELDYRNAQTDLKLLKQKKDHEKAVAEAKINDSFKNDALLSRIKAMFAFAFSSFGVGFVYILFTTIFCALEFLVVLLKWKLPKSNYEMRLEAIEEIGRKRMIRLVNNDLNYFENGQYYTASNKAKEDIRKLSSVSLFN